MANNPTPEIFISYSWGGKSEELVDLIDETFRAKGITIIRDKNEMIYKDRIKNFMRQIGQGRCVIVIISKKYLTSKNCMFELMEVAKHGEFVDRIFPVVFSDAGIYEPVSQLQYIKHWENKIEELEQAMSEVSPANLHGVREDIDLYIETRATIALLMHILADMNTLSPEQHQDSNFSQLFESIDAVLNADAASETQQAEPDGPVTASVRDELIQLVDDIQLPDSEAGAVFKKLYHDCWPKAAIIPNTFTSAILVHKQADRATFDDGWHPILDLAERVARHPKCQAHAAQFSDWVDRKIGIGQPLEVDPTVVQARRNGFDEEIRHNEEHTASISPYIYVIVVPHKDNVNVKVQASRRYHLFVIYSNGSGKEEFWHSDESGLLTEKSFCSTLHGILQSRTIPKSTHFEFFLPMELLTWDIDAWSVWDNDFVTFGTRYPITVRMVERLLEPQKREVCADSWRSYKQQPFDGDFYFLIDDVKYSRLRPLYAKLRQGNHISLGIRLSLDEMANRLDIFRVLLEVGTPIAVWSRSQEQLCDHSRSTIRKMVTQHVLNDTVAKAAFNLRLDAFAQEDEDPSHPGTHLLHIVDNPNRMPRNLDDPLFEPQVMA